MNTPVVLVYVIPSKLYEMPTAGAGAVTVIVPAVITQFGCTVVTVGATGVAGAAFIVTEVAVDIHPPALLTVTLYVFAVNPLNVVAV